MHTIKDSRHHPLSKREMEIIALINQGFSRGEIAEKMCISIHTYDSYRKNIREKLRIKSQVDWAKLLTEFDDK